MPSSRPATGKLPSSGATGILLVAFFLCLYTLSYNGLFRVDDEHILAARAQSMALWGKLEDPQVFGNLRVRQLAAFGDAATQIEPLQSVIGAGLYRLASTLHLGGAQALFTLNIYSTALTAGCIFAAVLCLGMSIRTAVWSGVLFGAGTMAWPYAVTFYRDALAMCSASIAFLGWSILVRGSRRPWAGASLLIIGIGAGILTKNTIVAILPAFATAGIAIGALGLQGKGVAAWKALGVVTGLVLSGSVVAALLPSDGPLARFSLGYYTSLARHFTEASRAEILPALAGPFASPAKSIFLFSPPLLLAIYGIVRGWAKTWKVGLPALLFPLFLAAGQALFYREGWAGAFGWGLRAMLPCLPGLMIAGAPGIEPLDGRRAGRALLAVGLVVCAILQVAGSWVDLRTAYDAWRDAGLDPYATSAAWEARFLIIPGQVPRILDPSSWSVAWMRLLRSGMREALLAPLAAAGIGAFVVTLLLRALRARGAPTAAITRLLGVVAVILPIFPTLAAYQRDPAFAGDRSEFHRALGVLEGEANLIDWIAVDAYGTPLWAFLMNRWAGPTRWYALPYEIPGSPGVTPDPACPLPPMTVELLFSKPRFGDRLIFLTSQDSPDYALRRETCRLDAAYDLEATETFEGIADVELRIYRVR